MNDFDQILQDCQLTWWPDPGAAKSGALRPFGLVKDDGSQLVILANYSIVSSICAHSFIKEVASHGLSCLSFDYPGLGTNSKGGNPYESFDIGSLRQLTADFAQLINQLRARDPKREIYVLGCSFGALLTHATLRRYRLHLDGLVYIAPGFVHPSPLWLAGTLAAAGYLLCGQGSRLMPRSMPLPKASHERWKRFLSWGDRRVMMAQVELIMKAPALLRRGYSARYVWQAFTRSIYEWWPKAEVFAAKNLLLLAEKDREVSNPFLKQWAKRRSIPCETLRGSKHYVWGQSSRIRQEVVSKIVTFIRSDCY